jgi:hypothetical protein
MNLSTNEHSQKPVQHLGVSTHLPYLCLSLLHLCDQWSPWSQSFMFRLNVHDVFRVRLRCFRARVTRSSLSGGPRLHKTGLKRL